MGTQQTHGQVRITGSTTQCASPAMRAVFISTALLISLLVVAACVSPVPAVNPSRVREVQLLESSCDESTTPRTISASGGSAPIYFPADYDATKPHPVLVSLHPFLMGAYDWDSYSQFVSTATNRGYIVILPEGRGPGPGWSVPGGNLSDFDDVAWVDALIQQTARVACVDSRRIYAVGFSAGAALAVGMSCELPGRFAAIAGSGGVNLTSLCPNSAPTSALIMHGTNDSVVPITGNAAPFTATPPISVDQVVSSFRSRNNCDPSPSSSQLTPTVALKEYSCLDAALIDIRISGMGHTWPGGFSIIDFLVGPNNLSFSGTDQVLNFFDAVT